MRALVAALIVCAGCKSADFQSGHLQCAASSPSCPSGFHCAADGTCWQNGHDPDLAVQASFDLSEGPDLSLDLREADFAARADSGLDLSVGEDFGVDDGGCALINPASCCGVAYTLCGTPIECTGECASSHTLCGGAVPNQCGCPPAERTGIYRAVAGDSSTCYSTGDSSACPGFTLDGAPSFYTYLGDPPSGTSPLLRCKDGSHYTLTFDNTCGGSSTAYVDMTIGYVPMAQACGTVALHRYNTSHGQVYVLNPADAPSGGTEIMPPFQVWTN
jgi:hypothetical protein